MLEADDAYIMALGQLGNYSWMATTTARDHPGFPECGFPDYNFSLISWLSRLKNQLNIFAGHEKAHV